MSRSGTSRANALHYLHCPLFLRSAIVILCALCFQAQTAATLLGPADAVSQTSRMSPNLLREPA